MLGYLRSCLDFSRPAGDSLPVCASSQHLLWAYNVQAYPWCQSWFCSSSPRYLAITGPWYLVRAACPTASDQVALIGGHPWCNQVAGFLPRLQLASAQVSQISRVSGQPQGASPALSPGQCTGLTPPDPLPEQRVCLFLHALCPA